MNFALSEEQQMLIVAVRDFIKTELAPHEQAIEDTGFLDPSVVADIFAKSKAMGFYAMNIPEKFGGAGLSAVDTMLVEEQFGHTTDILIRRAFGNVYEALLACEGDQIERWLLPTVQGERVCSIAITETGAGSDAGGIHTKAELQADGTWLLNGSKVFISDGSVSDFFIVSAVTASPLGTGGAEISLFLVDKGLKGFELGKDQPMMGLRGTSHLEMFFDNVSLEPICLLGERGKGFKMAMEVLGRVRLAQVGARAIGKASHVLNLMTDYANERKQFGKSIGTFQMVQQMLADSVIEINAARLMVLHAAWLLDTGQNDLARSWIAMVKVNAAETLGRVVDRAVQVFGGMGFCKELPIERYYRDARIYRIFDGTSEIHRTVIARNVLKYGKKLFEI
jgi:acyl-CoA dehydrogenase